ncbi:MAG: 50S ribosomal protein L25/general stress protein Ctc [Pseudomonadota bacterium]
MADVNILPVSSRDGVGKGAARAARREGLVPAVVYGAGEAPQPVNIKQNELIKALKRGKFLATLLDLELDGGAKKIRVLPKEVQRDVVLDLPTHVDFLRLSDRSMISLYVSVDLENQDAAPGLKAGGVLTVTAFEVRIRCRAGAIPERIVCDLTGLEIGDSIGVDRLTFPPGVVLAEAMGADFTVGSVAAPSGLSGGDAGGADDGADGAEAAASEEGGDGDS